MEKKRIEILNLYPWNTTGLCHTKNGDLLVSMRSEDGAKVVRYAKDDFKEIQVIENDQHGNSHFSKGIDVLLLTENGNGDICVADYAGERVIVFHSSGILRFTYDGNVKCIPNSKDTEFTEFDRDHLLSPVVSKFYPLHIATDVNFQILIGDFCKNIIHVIDQNSNFICHIKHSCNGGLSIDADHNLLAGDYSTGEIKKIKYLKI